ncbi:1-acyl-sn-glycerol-3-phosphate acyltransferase [Novosphingobium kunmingense]|uniref:1-acyl-sn-glycerol-3-phosphate acyltransferase n=1 Tax=Novosphingobium kunmingense TaxID=1211806 RepID=A0A2N0H6A5_9SPHN|nr:lysophospholipid acyltransferase family protein [Novosphingobium kunmingense]PKB14475.1 1-acyl-sn-glycerol-3-phosphate acyltransferase [Novosphingobium kunmingense]
MRVLRSLAFYIAFYGASLFIVLACIATLLLASRATFRRTVHSWSAWQRICCRHLLGITIRVDGTLPDGPVLVALKHESFFEAIDLPQLLDTPGVFAKVELMRIPLWGLAGRRYGLVSVERDQGARALRHMLAEARALVADGRPLAIFPEGTRVPHGTRPELKSGFAGLYKLLGLPVVAVALDSGPLYHRWIKRPGVITYKLADPIPPGLPRDVAEARVRAAINALNA